MSSRKLLLNLLDNKESYLYFPSDLNFFITMCVVCIVAISAASLAASLALSGCSSKTEPTAMESSGQLANLGLPDWVADPYEGLPEGSIAGVGISSPPANKGDELRFLILQSESNARAEIANSIQSEVSRMVKDAMRSAGIDGNKTVESSFSAVTQEVVKNIPISGAVRNKIFVDKNGVVYTRLVIKDSVVKQYLQSHVKDYAQSLEQARASRQQIDDTQAAMKSLFDELNLKTER